MAFQDPQDMLAQRIGAALQSTVACNQRHSQELIAMAAMMLRTASNSNQPTQNFRARPRPDLAAQVAGNRG
jgi:hypothetical protein